MSTPVSDLHLSPRQDDETMRVTLSSYELEAKNTTQSADIAITLTTSCDAMLIDLVNK
jgi:hypothetical protein